MRENIEIFLGISREKRVKQQIFEEDSLVCISLAGSALRYSMMSFQHNISLSEAFPQSMFSQ